MSASQGRSSSASPSTGKGARKPGSQPPRDGRGRFVPAPQLGSPKTPKTPKRVSELAAPAREAEGDQQDGRLSFLEGELKELKMELWRLRDKLEEETWARKQLEEKLGRYEEEEREREEEKERQRAQDKRVDKEKLKSEMKEEMKEELKQAMEVVVEEAKKGGRGKEKEPGRIEVENGSAQGQKYRCLILTDSNGRDATPELVRGHMPPEEKGKYDIEIVVAYRLEDAYHRIQRGDIDVKGAYVVIDNLTNNIRGNWSKRRETPDQVVDKVARVRELILSKSAVAVVVCEVKPMEVVDVRPYNRQLHSYLDSCGKSGYGCNTQIKLDFLTSDGFHISHKYWSVLHRTYACALLGIPVPCPLRDDDFIPLSFRRRWETQWPRLEGRVGSGFFGS